MMESIHDLKSLWKLVEETNAKHFPNNDLLPIVGGGREQNPDYMFVFINPTIRNISSHPDWQGPRFPFIGTKQVWRIFNRAGLLDIGILEKIEESSEWSLDFTLNVREFLQQKSFYFTNIVKWTGHNADLPKADMIKLFLPILEKEIEIVRPKFIITFGLIPFTNLTKETIKLGAYYSDSMKSGKLQTFDYIIGGTIYPVIPSYFPVGRGNPKRAVEILRMLPDTVD